MAVSRITYPEKTNLPTDPDNVRKFLHDDANEIKDAMDNHADHIEDLLEAIGLGSASDYLGEFISLAVLQAEYPDGADGSYAVINDGLGGTPQVATYNDVSELWELSVPDQSVIFVASLGDLPATGVANRLYVAKDSGIGYYYDDAQYKTLNIPTTPTSLNTYIDINSGYIPSGQKVMGVKAGINGGGFFIGTATEENPTDNSGISFNLEM